MRQSLLRELVSIVVFAGSISAAHAVPNAPSNLKAISAMGQINLQWTVNSTDELNFRLERSPDGVSGWVAIQASIPAGTKNIYDGPLDGKDKRFYRVRAENASGPSAWSNVTWSIPVYTGKPLSTWLDVTQPFGTCPSVVRNDGLSDSLGVQCRLNALPALPGANGPYVLYFPNGEYDFDVTVFLEAKEGVMLIGESTAGTIMKWIGPTGGFITVKSTDSGPRDSHAPCDAACQTGCVAPGCTLHQEVRAAVMFHNEGSKLCTFRNFTWDGNHPVSSSDTTGGYVVAFDESACGNTSSGTYSLQCNGLGNSQLSLSPSVGYNDTGSAHLDSVFKNAWVGLRIGHYNFEVDEMTIRRCTFLTNAFGISVEDFNALQEYIWDSRFESNWYAGITNYIANWDGDSTNWAGDFRVIRSRFVNNKERDIHFQPTGYYTIRDNWSKGSGQFVHGFGYNGTRTPQTIIHNQVDAYDSAHAFGDYAIEIKNAGATVLLDNSIDSDGRTSPPVYAATFVPSDILTIGNTYTIGNGNPSIAGGAQTRSRSINDTLNGPSFDLAVPALPTPIDDVATLPVYTVTDINNFQEVIDIATAQGGHAIVHVPGNYYPVSSTITVASGSSLHILGDGLGPFLDWTGAPGGVMMRVDGSGVSGLTIQGLWFRTNSTGGRATALVVENLDQDQSRVFVNRTRAALSAGSEEWAGIDFDQLNRNRVDIFDSGASGIAGLFGTGGLNTGFRIRGGSQQSYPFSIWTSTLLGNSTDFWVTNGSAGAKVLFSSVYMENSRQFFRLEGNTAPVDICIQGCKAATSLGRGTNALSIENVGGNVGVVSTQHFDFDFGATTLQGNRIEQSGSTAVEIQSIGNDQWEDFVNSMGSGGHLTHLAEERWNCQANENPSMAFCPQGSNPFWSQITDSSSVDNALVESAFSLLRVPDAGHPNRPTIPAFYDEPGAQEPHQINLDTIFIEFPLTGIQLTGGAAPAYFSPFDLTTTLNASSLTFNWSKSAAGSTYEVYRADVATPTSFTLAGTTGTDITTFNDTPAEGVKYYYKVRSRNASAQFSGYSNLADAVLIKAPSSLVASGATVQPISLTWTDNSSIEDNFHVLRSASSGGPYTDITTVSPPTSPPYSDSTVAEGSTYYYKVLAHDAVAGDSVSSNVANAVAPVKAPTNATAGAGTLPGVHVGWTDASSIEQGYDVQRKLAAQPDTSYASVGTTSSFGGSGSTVGFDDGSTSPATAYSYKVKAKHATLGDSLFSAVVNATTPGLGSGPNPASPSSGASRKRVLRWTAGSGAIQSDVYFGTSSSQVGSATRATSGVFKGTIVQTCFNQNAGGSMNSNTTYYWRIDSVSAGGISKGTVWQFTTGTSSANDSCP